MTQKIVTELCRDCPGVPVVSVTHTLTQDDFAAQKDKHRRHGAQGGVIGIVLTPDRRIVLAHRTKLHQGWSLPGGTVEPGEMFAQTLQREMVEEVGLSIHAVRLALVEDKRFLSPDGEELPFVLATYTARIAARELPAATPDARREGLTVRLFDLADLPPDMIFGDKQKIESFAATIA